MDYYYKRVYRYCLCHYAYHKRFYPRDFMYAPSNCYMHYLFLFITLYAIGELGGFGYEPSFYGYGTVGSSVVTSPPDADGNFYIEQLIDFLLHRFHFRCYDFELCHFLMRDCLRSAVDFCKCLHRKY
jgi:hypothetical protein